MPRLMIALPLGALLIAVAACSRGEPNLMNIRNTESGPDEFSVLPTEPLEMPGSFAALPTPTPGGINRADPTPEADAIAALGGNVDRANRQAGDIVNYSNRFGVTPDIRGTLSAEDRDFRDNNRGRLLERVFGVNTYYSAYGDQSLDNYAELERLRRAGVRTPAAPPEELQDQ